MNSFAIMPDEVVDLMDNCQINDHMCGFYMSEEERDVTVSYYILIGLEKGERVIYIDNDNDHSAIIRGLQKLSIDVDSVIASGQLSILDRKQTYLSLGHFDPDNMINQWKEISGSNKKKNYSGLRAVGDVPCDDSHGKILDKVLQYEVELNNFFPNNDALALCMYNRSLFPKESLARILFTHPLVLHKNTVCTNSYFISPENFSPDLGVDQGLDKLLEQIWVQNKR